MPWDFLGWWAGWHVLDSLLETTVGKTLIGFVVASMASGVAFAVAYFRAAPAALRHGLLGAFVALGCVSSLIAAFLEYGLVGVTLAAIALLVLLALAFFSTAYTDEGSARQPVLGPMVLFTIVETKCTLAPQLTYPLKIHVHIRNDTGRDVAIKLPTNWVGLDLYRQRPNAGITTLLQLFDARTGKFVPNGPDGEPEITVPAGRIFRFWLGFDPTIGLERLKALHSKTAVGTFTLPVAIDGSEFSWSSAL